MLDGKGPWVSLHELFYLTAQKCGWVEICRIHDRLDPKKYRYGPWDSHPGGWGVLPNEKVGDTCWKIWMKHLKETNLGVVWAFFLPLRGATIMEMITFFFLISSSAPQKVLWLLQIVPFCLEPPKWHQNLSFLPLSEIASIPDFFRKALRTQKEMYPS